MTSQKEAAESLIDFTDDVGIPETLVMDGVTEFTAEQGRKNQTPEATDAEEKCLFSVVGLRISIQRRVDNKNVMWRRW
jgi:hypothetical protein